jgi:hypothetical protein
MACQVLSSAHGLVDRQPIHLCRTALGMLLLDQSRCFLSGSNGSPDSFVERVTGCFMFVWLTFLVESCYVLDSSVGMAPWCSYLYGRGTCCMVFVLFFAN